MKKCSVSLVLVIILVLCSCIQQNAPTTSEKTTFPTTETIPATETVSYAPLPNPLPLPDSIKLSEYPDHEFGNNWEFRYRFVYYDLPWEVYELAEDDGFSLNMDGDDLNPFGPKSEMVMVTFIKHYDIKKEDFVFAVLRIYNWRIYYGFEDIYAEGNELPNADIIYTFDNEIINAYYRRENPVVPDEYRTYESYEEYLKANR